MPNLDSESINSWARNPAADFFREKVLDYTNRIVTERLFSGGDTNLSYSDRAMEIIHFAAQIKGALAVLELLQDMAGPEGVAHEQ